MSDKDSIGQILRRALRLDRAVALVWKSAPGWTLANLALVVVQGLLPAATLYLVKRIVDAVAAGVAAPDKVQAFSEVLLWVLLAGGIALLAALCRSLSDLAAEAQSLAVTDEVSDVIHGQSVAVDLGYYESPEFHDTLHQAQRESPWRPASIVNGLARVGQNGLAFLGVAALVFSFDRIVGAALVAAAVPGALVRLAHARRRFDFERERTETERRAWYYHGMMTDGEHAKEIRLFDLGSLFRERYRTLRQLLREGRLALARRRATADLAAQAAAVTVLFAAVAYVARRAVAGSVGLGELVMYYQGFQACLSHLQSFLGGLAGLYEDSLFLGHYYRFLDIAPKVAAPARPEPVPGPWRRGIAFEGVGFSYPGADREALETIDLTIGPGEVVAFVGENGSGKTTLVKLLCRLYDPSRGRITLDGIDLRRLDPARWRREIGVLFQDHVRYDLSVLENIRLGDAARDPDRERITEAARASGADGVIGSLPHGYDTLLGKQFDGGHELSAGEWRKVALARAFMRDARLVVLDEPAGSLDALAEEELFLKFRRLIGERSAVLVSHRFSTVKMADRICVMDGGRIVEHGTHDELLRRGGTYARLYRAQAEPYRDDAGQPVGGGVSGRTRVAST